VGGVLGMGTDVGALLGATDRLVAEGMSRVKLKIAPGHDIEPLTAVRNRYPDLFLQGDANGSYAGVPGGPPPALDELGLVCIEQPLGVGDFDGHARLARSRSTPVCLDESLDSAASVRRALALGACSVVCVKPARLGGIGQALEACGAAAEQGVPLWVGGMYESGYGRAANAGLATGPGRWLPGDLSRPSDYLEHPVTEDPVYVRTGAGRFPAPEGPLHLVVPSGPGLAPMPDAARLQPWCRQRRWLPAR
jgi:O-succinylbenzoate synthase